MSRVDCFKRIALLLVVTIALPVGIVGWSLHQFRLKLLLYTVYNGSIKNGELWFSKCHLGNFEETLPYECRIYRRNLATGVEFDTGLSATDQDLLPQWIGDDLYVISDPQIYRLNGKYLDLVATPPRTLRGPNNSLFIHDGRLTTVVSCIDGGYRLAQLDGSRWIESRKIRLPPSITLAKIDIQQSGQDVHVFCWDSSLPNGFFYHLGLEFEADKTEPATALSAENAELEERRWEVVPRLAGGENLFLISCDPQGALFAPGVNSGPVHRRSLDGRWGPVVGEGAFWEYADGGFSPINFYFGDARGDEQYVYEGTGEIGRIEGNSIRSTGWHLPTDGEQCLDRWRKLTLQLMLSWLLHIVLTVVVTRWLLRSSSPPAYQFGNQQVNLAPVVRRSLALTIDLLVGATVLIASSIAHVAIMGFPWPTPPSSLVTTISNFEQRYLVNDTIDLQTATDLLWSLIPNDDSEEEAPATSAELALILTITLDTALVWWTLMLYDEGRYGMTVGKWLIGIRTRRSTLRPCGFARSLVRSVLLPLELLFGLSPLPAAVSMILSGTRQRWGDRIADTVVVEAHSQSAL